MRCTVSNNQPLTNHSRFPFLQHSNKGLTTMCDRKHSNAPACSSMEVSRIRLDCGRLGVLERAVAEDVRPGRRVAGFRSELLQP